MLFLIGVLLLGLGGFINFGHHYRSSFGRTNFNLLLLSIPFILPYFIFRVKERFFKKTEKQIFTEHSKQNNDTVFKGEKLELIFKKCIISKSEIKGESNNFIGLLDDLGIDTDYYPKSPPDFYTVVLIQYRLNNQTYRKELMFPFTLKNTEIFLKMNPSTYLYYQKDDHENAKVDLRFLKDYL